MIGRLNGIIAALGEEAALIECGGVGYVAHAGSRTLARLELGAPAILHVETQVREDSFKLFGFLSEEERLWFVHLQSAPGVGAKVALNIVDALGAEGLADALALQDKASLARANGVGPKLAARIVQELAGKAPPRGFMALGQSATLAKAAGAAPSPAKGARADAVSALLNLGLDQASAARAVAAALQRFDQDPATSDLIREALREIEQ